MRHKQGRAHCVFPVGANAMASAAWAADRRKTHAPSQLRYDEITLILAHFDVAKLVPIPKRARNAVALDLSVKLGHNMRGDSATPPIDIRTYAKTKARA